MFPQQEACGARGKRRGFSPAAAARHSRSQPDSIRIRAKNLYFFTFFFREFSSKIGNESHGKGIGSNKSGKKSKQIKKIKKKYRTKKLEN